MSGSLLNRFRHKRRNAAGFEKYVRDFEIEARATNVTCQQTLKNNFLRRAGWWLQEVYFLLPEAVVEPEVVAENGKETACDDC